MSRHKQRPRKEKKKSAQPKQATPTIALEQDWSRAGAHNIAGVTFQVAVTARLLLDGRAGELPLTRATPEGYEDIDVQFIDGTSALVQVKERSQSTAFTRSNFANALEKKSEALAQNTRCRFVLATDATLSGGLSATGWSQPLSQCLPKDDLDRLAALLEASFDDPYGVLSRAHVLQVERSVADENRRAFARVLDIHPSAATLAYARLIEQIAEIAVRQRTATPETAEWIAPTDLDTLVTRLLEAVDVESLDEAVRAGIVEPVDFRVRSDLSATAFLAGVDVLPTHIAADLDLPRPAELVALTAALEEQHSALLIGPSGAGKSALMWRTARELAGRVRPYQLLRLLPDDVPTLARWIRLQEPSRNAPLLICADNLGRPSNEGWTAIAREFMDRPGVLLLGACREEEYRPELAVGRTTIVDPKLDREFAGSISETLANRQVLTVLDGTEAFEASDGLLMEFLSMLLTGRRIQQVVEEQVSARLVEGRATEREILRYVATAHAAGVSVPAEILGTLISGRDLTPSLSLLYREHILVSDDESRWQGLHELRSTIARDLLHQIPPPTIATTLRHLVEHLPARDASRIIEAYARLDVDLMPAAEAVSEILNAPDVSPEDGAQLVASLAMADAFHHARECLGVIEDLRPNGLDPETALLFAYTHRFAGVSFDSFNNLNPNFSSFTEMPSALPPRPESLRDLALRNLSSETARDIATQGTPDQAIAWLESLEGSVAALIVPTKEIWTYFSEAQLEDAARLSATLTSLAFVDSATRAEDLYGDFDHRIRKLANDLPDCVGVGTEDASDGKVVTLRLLVPADDATLHEQSVQTCRLILDLCPEADIAEIIVLTPDGDRHSIDDFQPGHKRIPRTNLPRAPQTEVNANFLRAGRLFLASQHWTEPIRMLAEVSNQLLRLRNDAVSWLVNPHQNVRRRLEAAKLTSAFVDRLAAGPKEPVEGEDTGNRASAIKAMSDVLLVVRDIAVEESPDDKDRRSLALRCRSAVGGLMKARQGNLPKLSSVNDPLPEALDEVLKLLADVLFAQAEHSGPSSKNLRRGRSESWVDVARRFAVEVAFSGYEAEREALEEALGTPRTNCEIRLVERADMDSVRFLANWWVLVIQADDDTSDEGDDPAPPALIDRLPPSMAQQLAFRTFVVFSAGGCVLPLVAVTLGGSRFWPTVESDLQKIASGLGVEVMESIHLQAWDSFFAELVGASRAATLLRLRQKTGLVADEAMFNNKLSSAWRAAEGCHPSLQAEARRLLTRVTGEPYDDQQTLAGEVYRSLTHGELGGDVAAIPQLRVDAISIDY